MNRHRLRRSRSTLAPFSRRLVTSPRSAFALGQPLRATVALSPIASLPRLFHGARRSAGSGEAVAGIFVGSAGGFYAYHASTPARVVLLLQSSIAGRFLPVEALHNGSATPECDFWPPAVQPRLHCSLLPRPLVDVGLPPAVVDMLCNLRPARQSM